MTGRDITEERARELDAVIVDWMETSAPRRAPASLRETLEDVTAIPPAQVRWRGQRLAAPAPRRFRAVRGFAAAAAAAALVIAALIAFPLLSGVPAVSPSPSASAPRSAGPSATAVALTLGAPHIVATLDAGIPALAEGDGYVLASGWSQREGGSTCPAVPVVRIDRDGTTATSMAWNGQILALASSREPYAIALDAHCSPMVLSDVGGRSPRAIPLAGSEADWEGDHAQLIEWVGASGLVYWDGRAGVSLVPLEAAGTRSRIISGATAPIGTTDAGLYVLDGSRRVVLLGADPADPNGSISRQATQLTLPSGAAAPAVLFGDQVVFTETGRGIGIAALDGASIGEGFFPFDVWRLSSGPGYVAALGVSGGDVTVAISPDGLQWSNQVLPDLFAKMQGGSVVLLATAGRVYVGAPAVFGGGVNFYALDVVGSPAQTATPTATTSPTASPSVQPNETIPPLASGPTAAILQSPSLNVGAIAFQRDIWLAVGDDGHGNGVVAHLGRGRWAWGSNSETLGKGGFDAAAITADALHWWVGRACDSTDSTSCEAGVWAWSDGRSEWQKVSAERALSLSFVDATHGWAILAATRTGTPIGGTVPGDVAFTSDGGKTWVRIASPCATGTGEPASVSAPDAVHVWVGCAGVVGAGSGVKSIVASADGGKTWEVRASAPFLDQGPGAGKISGFGYLNGIAFDANGNGFTWEGRDLSEWTRDGGRTWTSWPPGGDNGEYEPQTGCVEADGTWILGVFEPTRQAFAILQSTDQGATWTEVSAVAAP